MMAFATPNFVTLLAQPGNLLLGVLVVGLLLQLIGWRRSGLWLVGFATLVFVALAVLPLGAWMLMPLENRFPRVVEPPQRVDGIVVLGGSFRLALSEDRGQVALNESADRLTGMIALARRYPDARRFFTPRYIFSCIRSRNFITLASNVISYAKRVATFLKFYVQVTTRKKFDQPYLRAGDASTN